MEQYKDIIHKLLEVCEEAAKLTGNPWDDQIASVVHEVFDRYFHIVHKASETPQVFGAANVESQMQLSAIEVEAMPPWLVKFLGVLVKILPLLV